MDGEHVMDTPYFVDLHDVSKVDIISAKQKWLVGKPVDFEGDFPDADDDDNDNDNNDDNDIDNGDNGMVGKMLSGKFKC